MAIISENRGEASADQSAVRRLFLRHAVMVHPGLAGIHFTGNDLRADGHEAFPVVTGFTVNGNRTVFPKS